MKNVGERFPVDEKQAEDAQDEHEKELRKEQRLYPKATLFRIAKLASQFVMNIKKYFHNYKYSKTAGTLLSRS